MERTLQRLEGVESVSVDLAQGVAILRALDTFRFDPEKITSAIASLTHGRAGYQVVSMTVTATGRIIEGESGAYLETQTGQKYLLEANSLLAGLKRSRLVRLQVKVTSKEGGFKYEAVEILMVGE